MDLMSPSQSAATEKRIPIDAPSNAFPQKHASLVSRAAARNATERRARAPPDLVERHRHGSRGGGRAGVGARSAGSVRTGPHRHPYEVWP